MKMDDTYSLVQYARDAADRMLSPIVEAKGTDCGYIILAYDMTVKEDNAGALMQGSKRQLACLLSVILKERQNETCESIRDVFKSAIEMIMEDDDDDDDEGDLPF